MDLKLANHLFNPLSLKTLKRSIAMLRVLKLSTRQYISSTSGFPVLTSFYHPIKYCAPKRTIESFTTCVTEERSIYQQNKVGRISQNAYLQPQSQVSSIALFHRYFSSRPPFPINNKNNNNNFRKKGGGGGGPLVNEHLIKRLLRKSRTDAQSTQIRLVIDRGADVKPDVELMSLRQAIAATGELGVDLVGINLQQEVPIVKAVDYNKLLYDESKKKSVKGKGGMVISAQVRKEFQFKAGIDENDLNRKVQNMISYLQKGHPCQVAITSNRRNLRQDSNAVVTTLDRVRELVGENGNQQGQMKKNAFGSRGSLLFQPTSNKGT